MSIPGAPTNCSNSASASYNGSAVTNVLCNTDLILTNINNQAATANSDQFSYVGIFKASTAGTAQLNWAQGTATAVATTISKDTILTATRLVGADIAEVYYSDDNSMSE